MQKRRRKTKKRILFLSLLILIGYISFAALDICFYSRVDEKTTADAAIVLGAGVWDNESSPVFKERINHAVWLYENGYVQTLIFTGGKSETGPHSESSVARDYAIVRSVPSGENLYRRKFINDAGKYSFRV